MGNTNLLKTGGFEGYNMDMNYRKLLIEKLNQTVVVVNNKAYRYDQGIDLLVDCLKKIRGENRACAFCGNGGSAGIAVHMTADFLKNGRMKTYSFFNPATLTCMGNDFAFPEIYAKQIQMTMAAGDLLIAISSSGQSLDIFRAVEQAKAIGCRVITLTGFCENNTLKSMGDFNVYVPIAHYGIVESVHQIVLQQIVDTLMDIEL